jgi:ABC-type Zn uptake system ZnuABC Zn-binding protein ZnuA
MDSYAWRKPLSWFAMTILMVALVNACGSNTPEAGREQKTGGLDQGEKLRVVATTNIVGDVVSNVGGKQIELTTLMGVGVDPHSYVPTPADTAAVHDAHVVFANGLSLEAFLDEMLGSAGGDAIQVYVSEGLALRAAAGEQTETHDEAGDEHQGIDPHVWLDVRNVLHWVETIEQTLRTLDPANATAYEANADAYRHDLEELDAWIVEQVAAIPEAHRRLVTNHPAFGYFADRYGLEQVGAVYPISPSSEPSAQELAALEDTIRKYGVPAVFAESTVNAKLAEQVAQDTGIQLVPLYTGSLGGPGSGAESYIGLMHYNVNAIVEALK